MRKKQEPKLQLDFKNMILLLGWKIYMTTMFRFKYQMYV